MRSWRQQIFRIDAFFSDRAFYRCRLAADSTLKNRRKKSRGSNGNSGKQWLVEILTGCLALLFLVGIGQGDLIAQSSSSGGSNLSLSDVAGRNSNQGSSFRNENVPSGSSRSQDRFNSDNVNRRSTGSGTPSMPSGNNYANTNTADLSNTRLKGTSALSSSSAPVGAMNNIGGIAGSSTGTNTWGNNRNSTGNTGSIAGAGSQAESQQPLRGAYFQDQWSHGSFGNYSNRPPKPIGKEGAVPPYFPEGFLDPSTKTKSNAEPAGQAEATPKEKEPEHFPVNPVAFQERDDDEPNYEQIAPKHEFRSSTMAFASLIALAAFGVFVFADYRYRCWLQSVLSKNQRLLSPEAASADFDILEGEVEPEPALIGLFSENTYSDSLRFSEMMNRFKNSEISEEHLTATLAPSIVALPDTLLEAAQEGEFFVRKQSDEH